MARTRKRQAVGNIYARVADGDTVEQGDIVSFDGSGRVTLMVDSGAAAGLVAVGVYVGSAPVTGNAGGTVKADIELFDPRMCEILVNDSGTAVVENDTGEVVYFAGNATVTSDATGNAAAGVFLGFPNKGADTARCLVDLGGE